jgi:hypothetical protein
VDLVDADVTGDGVRHGPVVAGQQHRPETEGAQLGGGCRTGVLDRVGDPGNTTRLAVPGDRDGRASLGRRVREGAGVATAGASASVALCVSELLKCRPGRAHQYLLVGPARWRKGWCR